MSPAKQPELTQASGLTACGVLLVQIAQLLTIKRERELENKVSKRTSRSQQR